MPGVPKVTVGQYPTPVTLPGKSTFVGENLPTMLVAAASGKDGVLTEAAVLAASQASTGTKTPPSAAASAAASGSSSFQAGGDDAAMAALAAATGLPFRAGGGADAPARAPAMNAAARRKAARKAARDAAAATTEQETRDGRESWPVVMKERGAFDLADSFSDPRLAQAVQRRPAAIVIQVSTPPGVAVADMRLTVDGRRYRIQHGTTTVVDKALPYDVVTAKAKTGFKRNRSLLTTELPVAAPTEEEVERLAARLEAAQKAASAASGTGVTEVDDAEASAAEPTPAPAAPAGAAPGSGDAKTHSRWLANPRGPVAAAAPSGGAGATQSAPAPASTAAPQETGIVDVAGTQPSDSDEVPAEASVSVPAEASVPVPANASAGDDRYSAMFESQMRGAEDGDESSDDDLVGDKEKAERRARAALNSAHPRAEAQAGAALETGVSASCWPMPTPAGAGWRIVGSHGGSDAFERWAEAVEAGSECVKRPPVVWLEEEEHLSVVLRAAPCDPDSMGVRWYAVGPEAAVEAGHAHAVAADIVFLSDESPQAAHEGLVAALAADAEPASSVPAAEPDYVVLQSHHLALEGAGGASPAATADTGAAKPTQVCYWTRVMFAAPVDAISSTADAADLNACIVACKVEPRLWGAPVDSAGAKTHQEWLVGAAGGVSEALEACRALAGESKPARQAAETVRAAPGEAKPAEAAAPTAQRRVSAPKASAASRGLLFELD
jgi:hypothetical protein